MSSFDKRLSSGHPKDESPRDRRVFTREILCTWQAQVFVTTPYAYNGWFEQRAAAASVPWQQTPIKSCASKSDHFFLFCRHMNKYCTSQAGFSYICYLTTFRPQMVSMNSSAIFVTMMWDSDVQKECISLFPWIRINKYLETWRLQETQSDYRCLRAWGIIDFAMIQACCCQTRSYNVSVLRVPQIHQNDVKPFSLSQFCCERKNTLDLLKMNPLKERTSAVAMRSGYNEILIKCFPRYWLVHTLWIHPVLIQQNDWFRSIIKQAKVTRPVHRITHHTGNKHA